MSTIINSSIHDTNNKICGKNKNKKDKINKINKQYCKKSELLNKSVQTNIISKKYPRLILNFRLKQEINIKYIYNNIIMSSKGIVSRIYKIDGKKYYLLINKNDYEHLSIICENKQVIPDNILIKFETIIWQTRKLIELGLINLFI